MKKSGVPALIIALGIIGGTLAAGRLEGWLVIGGAMILFAAMVLANVVQRSLNPEQPMSMPATIILGGIFCAATAIVAASDPSRVPQVLPILGCGSVVLLFKPQEQKKCD